MEQIKSQPATDTPKGSGDCALYSPAVEENVAKLALDALAHWDAIEDDRYAGKRDARRYPYSAKVILNLFASESSYREFGDQTVLTLVSWGRNLSSSGISVLSSGLLLPFAGSARETPTVDLWQIVKPGDACQCGIFRSSTSLHWMDARIVRIREVQQSMAEIGIRFQAKLCASEVVLAADFWKLIEELNWND